MGSPSKSRLGVLTVGMGAVATTLYAGVEALRRGLTPGIGSFTQMGRVPLAARPGTPSRPVLEMLDLAKPEDMVFGGWDLVETDAYSAAARARVLSPADLASHRKFLSSIKAFRGIADPAFTTRLKVVHAKPPAGRHAQAEAIRGDIRLFRRRNRCARLVVLSCMSVEVYAPLGSAHRSGAAFEAALKADDPSISPSQIYAYAAIAEGVPFINGTPNPTVESPAIRELARRRGVPLAGSDFKSGQTYLKTVIAAGLRNRLLGLTGWFSTNILGNRDGEVLEDPSALMAKKETKTRVLADICRADLYPSLYGGLEHLVTISFFAPRGDNKEAWDSVDLVGWLGYPMQLKINFECRDSILAAPLALDLVLLADLAARDKASGALEWLSFYFKAPVARGGRPPGNDPNVQLALLERHVARLARRRRR